MDIRQPKPEIPKQLKAILFDFMGVLLFARVDWKPDPILDEIDRIIGKVIDDEKFKAETMAHYGMTEQTFDNALARLVGKYERFQPLWDILPALRNKYKLAIINNGTALTLSGFKKAHRLDKHFNLFVSSAIEGIRKPEAEIFLITTQRLGVKPEECLFMDDSSDNVEAAAKIGMQTIWWETKEKGWMKFQTILSAS